jgi:hypothetical protein
MLVLDLQDLYAQLLVDKMLFMSPADQARARQVMEIR